MDERRSELMLGLVILLAVAIVIGGGLWLSGRHSLAYRTYQVTTEFTDVTGLVRGDPITLAGVRIGKVTDIVLHEGRARLELSIHDGVVLPANSRARIEMLDLLGEQSVVILPRDSTEPLRDGDHIASDDRPPFTETVSVATKRLTDVADLLETSMGRVLDEANARRLSGALEDAGGLLATLRYGLDDDRSALSRTITAAERVTSRLDTLTRENRPELRDGVVRLHRAALRMDSLVTTLEDATRAFTRIAGRIERGEGTLGKLVAEERAYTQLLRTIASVDSLIADIKAQPRRYFHISVF
jgi:phospholipid/cholesterol/gamma-HCH transport system substrate-binding protein